VRSAAATGAIITVVIYLTAQMVGAGKLIELLFKDMHLKYIHAVVGVGVLMMVYVLFGGMKATTWVQIIKAVLLIGGATVLVIMILAKFKFSPSALFGQVDEKLL